MLSKLKGYRVLEAPNADTAIGICNQYDGPIHLLVSDVIMPGMNGQALATYLTSLYPDMRALLISGYSLESPLSNRASLGFLAKTVYHG